MYKNQKGQTLIETALILFLLLIILLGITEFARAWYTKSSLKNAVRQGARVAAVTSGVSDTSFTCNSSTTCPNRDLIIKAVCCQPGVPRGVAPQVTTVTLTITDDDSSGGLNAGDTITVDASSTFTYIVGGSPWPWPDSTTITTNASMRYE